MGEYGAVGQGSGAGGGGGGGNAFGDVAASVMDSLSDLAATILASPPAFLLVGLAAFLIGGLFVFRRV